MGQSSATSAEPSGGGSRTASLVALAALVAVGGAAYSNSFQAPFVLDDWNNITENPFVRWTSLDLESVRFTIANAPLLRPVAYLTFALNHWLGGYEVSGYHAANLAIHLANACWVYALTLLTLRRLLSKRARPLPLSVRARLPALRASHLVVDLFRQIIQLTFGAPQRFDVVAENAFRGTFNAFL